MNWSGIARRVRVPLGFVLAFFYLWIARPALWSVLAGGAIAAIGLGIRALASGMIRKNEALTTSGLYARTRNPLYLGSIVIAGGFALAARSWIVAAALLAMFLLIYMPVIRGEERFLRGQFPEFADYEGRVPRLIPRLGKILGQREAEGKFSCELYMKHREYNALAGTIGMLAVLAAKLFWLGR